jgi:hypothetical protein
MSGPLQYAAPVTVDDIQRRLGPKPQDPAHPLFPSADEWAAIRARGNSPLGRASARLSNIGARTQESVDALRSTIADVAAHPARPANAFKVVGSMASLVPSLLATPLAAGIDKLMTPVTQAYNNAFGGQTSPRTPTDTLLNGASFVIGPGEIEAGLKAAGEAALALPAIPPIEAGLAGRLFGKARVAEEAAAAVPEAVAAASPQAAAADKTLAYIQRIDPRLMNKPHFMPDDAFSDTVHQAGEGLAGLPKWAKRRYDDVIDDAIREPILDDPDFSGFSHQEVGDALSTLKGKAFAYRQDPANTTAHQVADAFDQVHDELVAMVERNRAGQAPVKPQAPTPPATTIGGPKFIGDTSGGAMVRQLPVNQGPISTYSPEVEALLPPIGDPARPDHVAMLKMVVGAANDGSIWKQFRANPDPTDLTSLMPNPDNPGVRGLSSDYSPRRWSPAAGNDSDPVVPASTPP